MRFWRSYSFECGENEDSVPRGSVIPTEIGNADCLEPRLGQPSHAGLGQPSHNP